MEKTLEIHLQEQREEIIKKIRERYFNCVAKESFYEAACYNDAINIIAGHK